MSVEISIPEHILFEDPYILVINKPAGLMVEPDRNGYPNLLQQVKKYLKPSVPIGEEVYAQHIHRLDRPVSGIILFAKQRSVLRNLSEQFAERKVRKYYQALTTATPELKQGMLENWHRKEKKKAMITDEALPYSEKVLLNYSVKPLTDQQYLWSIELHTGKFHQIRAQLAHIGCPILGDEYYGSPITYHPDTIALHASKLIFTHPVSKEEMVVEKKIY